MLSQSSKSLVQRLTLGNSFSGDLTILSHLRLLLHILIPDTSYFHTTIAFMMCDPFC